MENIPITDRYNNTPTPAPNRTIIGLVVGYGGGGVVVVVVSVVIPTAPRITRCYQVRSLDQLIDYNTNIFCVLGRAYVWQGDRPRRQPNARTNAVPAIIHISGNRAVGSQCVLAGYLPTETCFVPKIWEHMRRRDFGIRAQERDF